MRKLSEFFKREVKTPQGPNRAHQRTRFSAARDSVRHSKYKLILARYHEIRRRKMPRIVQAAKTATILARTAHRELGDLRDGAIEVEGIEA